MHWVVAECAKPELTQCDHHQRCRKGKVGDIRANPRNQSQEIATARCHFEKARVLSGAAIGQTREQNEGVCSGELGVEIINAP